MTFVKTWTLTPPGRQTDTHPWVTLRIREAAASTGPWTVIDTQPWTDLTPTTPDPAVVETTLAALDIGWYEFEWQDDTGAVARSLPVYDTTADDLAAQITPTVAQVSSHIRSRTRDDYGSEGEFTADTRPTASEVQAIAGLAARYVALEIGDAYGERIDEQFIGFATDVAALNAALRIETSFFTDSADVESALSDQLGRMFREQLAALKTTARNNQTGGRPFHTLLQAGDGYRASLP